MNLKFKFTFLVLIFSLTIILFLSCAIYFSHKSFLKEQFSERRESSFKTLLDSCTKSLKTNKDYQIIEEVIAVSKPVVLYASFVDEYSKVFVFRDDTKTGYNFVPKLQNPYIYKTKEYKSLEETIFEYSSPIFFGDQYKGSLIVGFSQDNMNYCINKEAAVIFKAIKYIAAISIFLSVLGTGLIVRLVIKPIKETDSLKDKFISNISHELRTPLFVIEGYCNLLIRKIKENYSCSQQIKGLNIIKKSAERLRRFIDNILDLTKLKSGNFDIDMTPIDINEAIKETADYFKSLALEQKKAFIFNMQDNIPNTRGDIKRIKQVIVNLLENAFKFTKSGDAITISSMMSPSYGNGYIEVWIADTGIGISKKNIKRIFEEFYQDKEGEYNKPKGTGLGLSVAYELIKLHGGNIMVDGEIGKGSVFKFILPVLKA